MIFIVRTVRTIQSLRFAALFIGLYAVGFIGCSSAFGQASSPRINLEESALRAAASVYPVPKYPPASIQSNRAGKVIVEVVLGAAKKNDALVRVQSTKVVEAADPDLANAVLEALKGTLYMPFFDDKGAVQEASGRVVWEFRISAGKPEVIDPYAVNRPPQTPADDLRIIKRAREILASESIWNRADNRQCPPNSKVISLYCALEKATQEINGTFEHRGKVMEDTRDIIDEKMPHPEYDHLLMGYNNDPSTTFADIQKVLRLTEERISNRINH